MSTEDPQERRAAWIAGMRKILDILEAHPDLSLPENQERRPLTWWMVAHAPRKITDLEKALQEDAGIRLTGAIDPENDCYYVLSGELDGMPVRIRAWATDVAERRVIGTRTVEDVGWVRLPAEDEAPGGDGGAEAPEGDAAA